MLCLLTASAQGLPTSAAKVAERIQNADAVSLAGGMEAEYTFSYTDVSRREVDVRLTLTGLQPEHGPVNLSLPQGFAFAQLPEPRLKGEVALDGNSIATLSRESAYRWSLQVAGDLPVSLEWTVPLDHRQQLEIAGRDE